MLDIIYGYQNLLDNINSYIERSKFKKEYIIAELGISRATFYNKVKKRNFTIDEMVVLSKMLFPDDAKAFEIKEALGASRKDSAAGRIRTHESVLKDVRKKLRS